MLLATRQRRRARQRRLRLYLTRMGWVPEPEFARGGFWGIPCAVGGRLVLSSYAQQAAGESPLAVVALDESDPDFYENERYVLDLGGIPFTNDDVRDARPTGKILDALERTYGYRPIGNSLADCLWDCCLNGDPANLDRRYPQIPGDRLILELAAFSGVLCSRRFQWQQDRTYDALVRDCLRRQLQQHRIEALSGLLMTPRFHLKIAGGMCLWFAGPDRRRQLEFFRSLNLGWPADELPDDPDTIVIDTFDRTDSSTLGTSSSGFTWAVANSGGVSQAISSNQAKGSSTAAAARSRLETDLASSNNYCKVDTVRANDASSGPCCRYQSGADSCYIWILRTTTNDKRRVFSISGGSASQIASDTTSPPSVTYTPMAWAGSTAADAIKVYLTGTEVSSLAVSNSTVTSGTRGGLHSVGAVSEPSRSLNDNFEMGDYMPVFAMHAARQRRIGVRV